MEHHQELPDYYRALSKKLYNVMENIGVTIELRSLMQEEWTAGEKLETVTKGPKYSANVFGSAFEGSQTRGMNSDVDTVYIDKALPVVIDTNKSRQGKCLLLRQDQSTPAGYAKLQLVQNGIPITDANSSSSETESFICDDNYTTCVDKMKRIICIFNPSKRTLAGNIGRRGPALTQAMNRHIADKDILFAFKSSCLPECTSEWFTRQRIHNWPSESDLETCKTMGCLLVPIGHPNSDEQKMQWRISMSHQERLLVSKFNSVQLKCFVLLKLVRKDVIDHLMQQESLTSYHCKTCMLYLIENTNLEFWEPENLVAAFVNCMKMLLLWTQAGVCPNYFIPSENMFERGIQGLLREKLYQVMQSLCSTNCGYLLHIKSDNLGSCLEYSITSNQTCLSLNERGWSAVEIQKMNLKYTHLQFVLKTRRTLLSQACNRRPEIQEQRLQDSITRLKAVLENMEQMADATQRAIALVITYLELGHLSTAIAFTKQESPQSIQGLLSSNMWQTIGLESDRYSSKLKQASHMYALGHFKDSLDILADMVDSRCYSFCFCNQQMPVHPLGTKFLKSDSLEISIEKHLYRFIAPCVAFTVGEMGIIPNQIFDEIVPSGKEGSSAHDTSQTCNNLVFIDGIFLIHFLLYLNHCKLNMTAHAESDIEIMDSLIKRKKPKISHKETAINLLKNAKLTPAAVSI